MPIAGLTGRGVDFAVIGTIRKGGPKRKKVIKGVERDAGPGPDLDYFRVQFDEGEEGSAQAFARAYAESKGKPRELRVWLPFNEISRCWSAWKEAYDAGSCVHRCDGETILKLIDRNSGEVLIKDGVVLRDFKHLDGRVYKAGTTVACNGTGYIYTKSDGTAIKVPCKPTGRLKVILPDLGRLVCLLLTTTSANDVANLDAQLDGIWHSNGGRIVGVPLTLKRRKRQVSTPMPNGKRQRIGKWMLSIETDESWTKDKMLALAEDAKPQITDRPSMLGLAPALIPAAIAASSDVVVRKTAVGDEDDMRPPFENTPSEAQQDEDDDDDNDLGDEITQAEPAQAEPTRAEIMQAEGATNGSPSPFVKNMPAWRALLSNAREFGFQDPNTVALVLQQGGMTEYGGGEEQTRQALEIMGHLASKQVSGHDPSA